MVLWSWAAGTSVQSSPMRAGIASKAATRLDAHPSLDEAVDHLSELGEEHAPSEIFAHYMDGRVVSVATFD